MITRITKDGRVSNRTETAGCVGNETVCLPRSELHCFLACECQLVYPEVKHFCAMLEKERAATCGGRALRRGSPASAPRRYRACVDVLKVFRVHLEYSSSATVY